MTRPVTNLPERAKRGDLWDYRAVNKQVVEPIRKLNQNFGRTGQVRAIVSAGGRVLSHIIVSEQADTITATPEGSTSPDDDVMIAKPETLRGNIATRPGNVFNQEIFPAYTVGARIFAMPSDETGVAGISLVDLNVDARQWAEPESGVAGG